MDGRIQGVALRRFRFPNVVCARRQIRDAVGGEIFLNGEGSDLRRGLCVLVQSVLRAGQIVGGILEGKIGVGGRLADLQLAFGRVLPVGKRLERRGLAGPVDAFPLCVDHVDNVPFFFGVGAALHFVVKRADPVVPVVAVGGIRADAGARMGEGDKVVGRHDHLLERIAFGFQYVFRSVVSIVERFAQGGVVDFKRVACRLANRRRGVHAVGAKRELLIGQPPQAVDNVPGAP